MKERELEDWICQNPVTAFGLGTQIIDRQVVLPNGVLDVLAWDWRILAIELKVRRLAVADVSQVLRYVGDLADILRGAAGLCPYDYGTKEFDRWNHYYCIDQLDQNGSCPIMPILVGAGLTEKVMAAAIGARCEVFSWNYSIRHGFTLTHEMPMGEQQLKYRPRWLSNLKTKIDSAISGD